MEKFENLGITTIVTGDKLKLEISISGLVCGFNGSPNNDVMRVKRGKRKEFARWVAQKIIDPSDPETGESPAMDMFEKVFADIFEGNDIEDEIFEETEEY